ncbi:MAG TPA: response regulator transcription factor [Bacteroidia bacterium]|nr:response regulator transcription factor [Bacteroidia bacterium]MBP7713267.1 response regulator transcription factor [Bacteroidia bacterium]MBP8667184.1 response regulator transcription factor [Bacteroidia bacterium]HOZ82837.1 response regulator transcription factor [Bacteroidia bacterium]HOZ89465.1 response regulator transcription factor [Bacteroidia bacterium]
MAVRVTIFDDNKRLLDSLSVLIDGSPGFQMAGIFENCNNLISDIERTQPDVILMDIEMPGINGIEAVKMVKHRFPKMNVMMQTAFENDENVFAAICAGASGYILKNTPPSKILECIIEVYQGGSPMSPSVARKVLGFLQQPKPDEKKETTVENYNLSAREKEILACLVKGMSYKMIAEQCNITYETVRSHMKNIYEKLHVASMTEAVAKAINQKLVS